VAAADRVRPRGRGQVREPAQRSEGHDRHLAPPCQERPQGHRGVGGHGREDVLEGRERHQDEVGRTAAAKPGRRGGAQARATASCTRCSTERKGRPPRAPCRSRRCGRSSSSRPGLALEDPADLGRLHRGGAGGQLRREEAPVAGEAAALGEQRDLDALGVRPGHRDEVGDAARLDERAGRVEDRRPLPPRASPRPAGPPGPEARKSSILTSRPVSFRIPATRSPRVPAHGEASVTTGRARRSTRATAPRPSGAPRPGGVRVPLALEGHAAAQALDPVGRRTASPPPEHVVHGPGRRQDVLARWAPKIRVRQLGK